VGKNTAALRAAKSLNDTPIGRFGIETDEEGDGRCLAYMPVHGLLSPITDPLALARWPSSSITSVGWSTITAVIAAHPDTPVFGTAIPVGPSRRRGSEHATSRSAA
jgi:hypothetical protein